MKFEPKGSVLAVTTWIATIALAFGVPTALGYTYAVADNRDGALGILRQIKALSQQSYPFPFLIAEVYTGLGDKDRAFEWLNRAYQERDYQLTTLKLEPMIDSLRGDSRFRDLVRRLGLPP